MARGRRVVITGLGAATPIGIGIEPFWDALLARQCGIRPFGSFDPAGLACRIGGELPEFSLADFIPKSYRKSAKVMARDIIIAVIAAYHAVKDAGLATRCIVDRGEAEQTSLDSTRFGANIGAGLICADLHELAGALNTAVDESGNFSLKRWGTEGINNLTPLWLLKFLPNMLACHVTIVHDAQAPSNTITCGEASSHLAIGEAFRSIARGAADVCICGGAESKTNPMAIARPLINGRLNTVDNDRPESASRPFGADCRGMVPSEGGGLLIIESLDHAKTRGARIYAELVGFGAASDASGWATPEPSGRGISRAISKALADAELTSAEVDLAVPQGLGTAGHDAAEIAGWNDALGDRLAEIPSMTTRGGLGVNGAGTGAIDFAVAVMALSRNTIPASLNTNNPDSACQFQFVQGDPKDVKIRHAVSIGTAAIGRQSAALVIRKFEG